MFAIGPAAEPEVIEDEVVEEFGDDDEGSTADPQLQEAGALNLEALTAFETHDYARAITLWGKALGVLDISPEHEQARNGIRELLAQAHARAYELDGDIEHLRIADRLLGEYLHGLPPDVEVPKVEEEVDRIQKELARYEEEQRQQRAAEREAIVAAQVQANRAAADSLEVRREAGLKQSRRFIISGALMAGAGVASLGITAGMLAWGASLEEEGEELREESAPAAELEDIIETGRVANGLAIGLGIGGGLLTTAGTSMLVIGTRRRRAAMQLSAIPSAGPRGAGLTLVGRF